MIYRGSLLLALQVGVLVLLNSLSLETSMKLRV